MNSKILIVEDDILTAANLASLLEASAYQTCEANTPEDAWEKFLDFQPDLVIMDIDLSSDTDGIELSARFNQQQKTSILYLTDKTDERIIQKARDVHHSYYMNKPFAAPLLLSQVDLILKQSKSSPVTTPAIKALFIKEKANESQKRKIPYDDIHYIKASRAYSEIYHSPNHASPLLKVDVSKSMAAILQKLPGDQFIQVHRSYAVNINKIDSYDRGELILADHTIPIGENYKTKISEILNLL
ncbi:LytR/AlgR family response regulator transcription factor [Phaeocystidibacter marisrubri]|uniref:Response regulator transcription factor n=1 Tax=Phaeocystidibacter marisrubri TaxID=1577780 RepID=A0A6L3ZIT2_9FLAO|nr:response regulator transcription factor [Phaeocystidibacter marisrubri]KAB2817080.1 response regulator transcription factor [Phaeocystidibacter marisrubri]GGH76943.1 hypothetical protein GCM10011318_25970 [Phaeocystidibacter marisrubri]